MKLSKILALVLALAMVLSFAACAAVPAAEETTVAEETTAAPVDDTAAEAPEGAPEIKDATDKITFADFTFKVNGKEITNKDLEGCSIYKITVETTNSKGNASENTYGGYAIKDVLKAAGCEDATSIVAVCNDGYEGEAYTITDVNAPYTLLAIEKDKEVGEEGTVWFAPCLETISSGYAKLVVELIAE